MTYRNFDDMLADPQVEAVIIGVADQFHVPLARQAIAAGKHVLVEKPLGVSIEECEALARGIAASPDRNSFFKSATIAASIRASRSPSDSSARGNRPADGV